MSLPRIDEEPSLGFRFAVNGLDRHGELRDDPTAVEALAADPRARFFVLSGSRVVVAHGSGGSVVAAHERATAEAFAPSLDGRIFLGTRDGVPCFALPGSEMVDVLPDGFEAIELRALAVEGVLPATDYGTLATARSLANWHAHHRHCACCGAPTKVATAGWRRLCPTCGAEHFPRTDPAVIMLIERGERCLLGRARHFPEGMWSCLAGFVEPGETIEAAVRRETMEEAGIRIGRVTYVASEPWPFPGSLMIGVTAQAEDETVRVDPVEMDDCRWFDRDEVRALLAGTHPGRLWAPPPIAIAHHLLTRFAEGV